MKISLNTLYRSLFLFFINGFQPGLAATEYDFQTWLNLTATGNINKESRQEKHFKYWLEGIDRFGEDSSRLSQAMVRLGLGYSLSKNTSLWLGHAWIHTGAPFTTTPFAENRIWEQLLWTKPFQYLTFSSRTRLEQRFLETSHKVAYRARQLIKIVVPLREGSNLSFVSSDELFWHKNNFSRNSKGFDQNRYFIGMGYKFNSKITTEIGYMNQYIRRVAVPNFCSNILAINFILNL